MLWFRFGSLSPPKIIHVEAPHPAFRRGAAAAFRRWQGGRAWGNVSAGEEKTWKHGAENWDMDNT